MGVILYRKRLPVNEKEKRNFQWRYGAQQNSGQLDRLDRCVMLCILQ
jgi:hypothetical protein